MYEYIYIYPQAAWFAVRVNPHFGPCSSVLLFFLGGGEVAFPQDIPLWGDPDLTLEKAYFFLRFSTFSGCRASILVSSYASHDTLHFSFSAFNVRTPIIFLHGIAAFLLVLRVATGTLHVSCHVEVDIKAYFFLRFSMFSGCRASILVSSHASHDTLPFSFLAFNLRTLIIVFSLLLLVLNALLPGSFFFDLYITTWYIQI